MPEATLQSRPADPISRNAQQASGQAISFLMQQGVENADCISLAAGLVDEYTLPVELVRETCGALLTETPRGRGLLQYGTTHGPVHLRRVFRNYLHKLEESQHGAMHVPLDRIVLTTGSQQLLQLITDAVVDPGDIVLVAAPTYFVYLGVVEALGGRLVPIECDDEGMCPRSLANTLAQIADRGELARVKIVYVVSYYDNPSGISVSTERRPELVQIVKQYSEQQRILLLEDAAYRELCFAEHGAPSIWSFDSSEETVALAQTFSKCFSPGIRVGLGILPEWLVKPVCDLKGNQDFGSAHLNQSILAEVLDSGEFYTHAAAVRANYRVKSEVMVLAAEREFGNMEGVTWVTPKGGLYVWMSLPESVETGFDSELFQIATKQEKVMYVPGELSYPADMTNRPRNQMRLTFGYQSVAGIEQGMRRLANAVRRVLPQ
jgi:2-aminoadipate transaminase